MIKKSKVMFHQSSFGENAFMFRQRNYLLVTFCQHNLNDNEKTQG